MNYPVGIQLFFKTDTGRIQIEVPLTLPYSSFNFKFPRANIANLKPMLGTELVYLEIKI